MHVSFTKDHFVFKFARFVFFFFFNFCLTEPPTVEGRVIPKRKLLQIGKKNGLNFILTQFKNYKRSIALINCQLPIALV